GRGPRHQHQVRRRPAALQVADRARSERPRQGTRHGEGRDGQGRPAAQQLRRPAQPVRRAAARRAGTQRPESPRGGEGRPAPPGRISAASPAATAVAPVVVRALFLALLIAATAAQAERPLFRSVDAEGRVTYSDQASSRAEPVKQWTPVSPYSHGYDEAV